MPAPFGSEARVRIFEAQPSGCAERIFPGKPSPWDLSGRFPVRPSVLRANRGVGRAPHARKGRHCANPNVFSFRPPAFRALARNHDMPWFELGRSLRTRGAHPSEKTAFRVISGLFPQGHPSLEGPPRRGGLRTPGREGIAPTGTLPRSGHGPFADPWVTMRCLGLRPARICGRTECVPPRKPAPALSQGFPRKAISPWMAHPAEGRAPHARNETVGLTRACPR